MNALIFILSLVIAVLIVLIFIQSLNFNMNKHVDKAKKDIYKDLFMYTTELDMTNKTDLNIIKFVNDYFSDYLINYKKVKKIEKIQFIKVFGSNKEYWYNLVEKCFKIFICLSFLFFICISLYYHRIELALPILLIVIFLFCIQYIKEKDYFFLTRMAIRFFFNEWGYCVYRINKKGRLKCKFVARVQLWQMSCCHKYLYSILNIVAVCRAVAYSDKLQKTERICNITNHIYELYLLFYSQTDCITYIDAIPLWISVLFEYQITQNVKNENLKKYLRNIYLQEVNKEDVLLSLKGFWYDITRKEYKEVDRFVEKFRNNIVGE